MRITIDDVKRRADRVNELTRNVNLIIGQRYGYTAIDIGDKNNRIIDTILAGLTKREAYYTLYAIYEILRKEYRG